MIQHIIQYLNTRKARKRFMDLGKSIDAIDKALIKKGVSRANRRQFWREFVNSEDFRKDFVKKMFKDKPDQGKA